MGDRTITSFNCDLGLQNRVQHADWLWNRRKGLGSQPQGLVLSKAPGTCPFSLSEPPFPDQLTCAYFFK